MRKPFEPQLRLDQTPIEDVLLNTNCRDEIIPILRALQHIYSQVEVRDAILADVASDVNGSCSAKLGREGMTYWQILVLAAVRLGCNLNYDKLQDLAENHRRLRQLMGLDGWDDQRSFDYRRIWENVCRVQPQTLEKINHRLLAVGHQLAPDAGKAVRGDGFVVQTNIHYPTDSSLLADGLRHVIRLSAELAEALGADGWRQHRHLQKRVKQLTRQISSVARKKGPSYRERLRQPYQELLALTQSLLTRATELHDQALAALRTTAEATLSLLLADLTYYLSISEHVRDQAQRRVIDGEQVPNSQKVFSVNEPDTELIKRGKTPNPIEFGHRVLLFEDAAGFICHYTVLGIGVEERSVGVEHFRQLQERLDGKIQRASFDRGFHSPDNQKEFAKLVAHPCLPRLGKQPTKSEEAIQFRQSRQWHPGVESAIGALQSGNGLARCRDHSRIGYERYVGLGILGRNLHVLGKLLLAEEAPNSQAAQSKRRRLAA